MTNFLGNILSFIFGTNARLATFIISMFPLVELKGAIPIGMSRDFFGDSAILGIEAFLLSLLGSSTIIFILPLIFKPIIRLLKKTKIFRKIGDFVENKVNKHSAEIIAKKKNTFLKCLAIFLFVAVPLPLTGVWTGCCVSVAIGLDYWQTVTSVFFGNIIAGFLIYFVCALFPNFTTWLFYIFLCVIVLTILISIIKHIITKKAKRKIN